MRRLAGSLALTLVAALTLGGCGGSDGSTASTADSSSSAAGSSSTGSSSSFNDADVTFAQSMIPHHQQAVEMAQMATTNASSPQVKQLADKIAAAQGPEIETMSGWLEDWGKKVPSGADHGSGHDSAHDMDSMGSGGMPGMVSDTAMKRLQGLRGAGFDRMFLTMMIEHHAGAIQMARAEESDGRNRDAVALATVVQGDQSAEIARMKRLLAS